MSDIVVVSGVRTPIGDLNKSLASLPASTLGGVAIKGALGKVQIDPEEVSLVIMGQVLTAGEGQCPARQAAVFAGVPYKVPAYNVNMVCGSGLVSVINGYNHLKVSHNDIVVAGGQESMSKAPHTVNMRSPKPMGDATLKDSMIADALTCPFNAYHMGITAENVAQKHSISRQDQDLFAVYSQNRTAEGIKNGVFKDEIVSVMVPGRKGAVTEVKADEHPRETTLLGLGKLKTCFQDNGTVTAGNCSSINDGGAACVLMTSSHAEERRVPVLGTIISSALVGCDPAYMGMGPVPAIKEALRKANWNIDEVDVFEINEAFAAQSVAVVRELKIPVDKVNVNGGAIALGHPVGMSGTRILITLLHHMKRAGLKRGVAALCVGSGMGVAVCVQNRC